MSEKRIYRLPPCPAYDVEGMESWLEAQAAKGLHLDASEPFFLGVATFVKGEPRPSRYRLTARRRRAGLLSDEGPGEEQLTLFQRMGWVYLGARGDFDLYRADDPATPELDTDPSVQAYAIRMVEKRVRGSLFLTVYWGVIYPLMLLRAPLQGAIGLGSWSLAAWLLVFLWSMGLTLAQGRYLRGLRRRLEAGLPPVHSARWRGRAIWHSLSRLVTAAVLLSLVLLVMIRLNGGSLFQSEQRQPLLALEGAVPFPTLGDLLPEGTYLREEAFAPYGSACTRWSDFLVPDAICWSEVGTVFPQGQESFHIHLYVDYYQTRSPLFAQLLARECSRSKDESALSPVRWIKRLLGKGDPALPLPPLEADYAYAFQDTFPCVVLRRGERVIRAVFFTYGAEAPDFSYQELAAGLAKME